MIIGRSHLANIRLDHPNVSRRHALIEYRPGIGWFVRDMQSRHGMAINGRTVADALLQGGDVIRIAEYLVEFVASTDGAGPRRDDSTSVDATWTGTEEPEPSGETLSPPPNPEGFAPLIDHLGVAIFRVAAEGDGVFLDANAAMANLLGVPSREALVGRTISRFFESVEAYRRFHSHLSQKQALWNEEVTLATLGGTRVVVSITARISRTGERLCLEGIAEDLTRLRKLERDYHRLFTCSRDLVCVAGLDGWFRRINPAFETTLGYTEGELLAKPFIDFVHPDDRESTQEELRTLASGAPTRQFENRYRKADGSYRSLEWEATPDIDRGFVYAIARDVTDRRRAEEAERIVYATDLKLRIAREVQDRLLPRADPVLPGWDLAGCSVPAEAVGGDYFDFIPGENGTILLVIGDAMGHGIGPAILMAETRACLRSLASIPQDLDALARRVNRVLLSEKPELYFVTLLLVRLDPATGEIAYCNCGHPEGLLLDHTGRVRHRLGSVGLPLGCQADCLAGNGETQTLNPGDSLVLVTDGVLEARNADGEFFGPKLLPEIQSRLALPARELCSALQATVQEFHSPAPKADDVSCLVLKRTAPYPYRPTRADSSTAQTGESI
ncbi:MAG: SpoIIE family protein phosphatase [Planctomycetota bacterium]|nr:SpoIIE family protein phosphatase [Planctomycetota bacterium]